MTLILTYHAVEHGPAPLCIEPSLFAEHVASIVASGAPVLTVTELAGALAAGRVPARAVAITFDDGCASVVEHAAPALEAHGLRATVFCVAGHVGGANDWPTQASWAPRLGLAGAKDLAALAAGGWEVGSHGVDHAPLDRADGSAAHREIVDSRPLLEDVVGAPVTTFAWPYGAQPSRSASELIAATYDAACAGGPGVVRPDGDRLALPRVDAHYLRDPTVLRRAIEGSLDGRLALRGRAAGLRRLFRKDYVVGGQE